MGGAIVMAGDPRRKTELGRQNLHLPLRHKEGGIVEKATYNGYIFRAEMRRSW